MDSKMADFNGIRLAVKREDLNHPFVSGNKWWKLKHNLLEASRLKMGTLLTFGGAYSNHIYATAAAAKELGMNSIGIIRGERQGQLNPTLEFAQRSGMQLEFVTREQYRNKEDEEFIKALRNKLGDFYLIPEGGTNHLAVKGCEEFSSELKREFQFDYLCLPVGTGGTVAGMINGLPDKQIVGFSSLKGGDFLNDEVRKYLTHDAGNWKIQTDFHFGGYGKTTSELIKFIREFERQHEIVLDPVYTAKMFFGINELMKMKFFLRGSTVLLLHTGGLQGRRGFNF